MLILVFTASKTTDFDANGDFLQYTAAPEFDEAFNQWLTSQLGGVENKVIHFIQGNCTCEWIANSHIESVKKLAQQQQKTNIVIDVTALPDTRRWLPATPAVAVYDKNGQLLYLGPYATGLFCTAGQGLVEKFITQNSPPVAGVGAVIPLDANGCYCAI